MKTTLVAVVLVAATGCGQSNPPLSDGEHRASQTFQNKLGAPKSDSDEAARRLNQMLERDKSR